MLPGNHIGVKANDLVRVFMRQLSVAAIERDRGGGTERERDREREFWNVIHFALNSAHSRARTNRYDERDHLTIEIAHFRSGINDNLPN